MAALLAVGLAAPAGCGADEPAPDGSSLSGTGQPPSGGPTDTLPSPGSSASGDPAVPGTLPTGFAPDAAIGISLPAGDSWQRAADALSQGLVNVGLTPAIAAASGASAQVEQIGDLVNQGVSVIIAAPVAVEAETALADARAAGAYVIAYVTPVADPGAADLFIGYDPLEVGTLQANALLTGLASSGDRPSPWTLELVPGPAGRPGAEPWLDGVWGGLAAEFAAGSLEFPGGEGYREAVAGGSPPLAKDGKRPAGLIAADDELLGAALDALASRSGPTPVAVGAGWDAAGAQRVAAGEQYATIALDPAAAAESTLGAIQAIQNGARPSASGDLQGVPATYVPPVAVTADNICEVFAADPDLAKSLQTHPACQ
ncbi:MAG: substrate-binding domain-containing protein [Propionibacteriaceae bacterium]|jgi:putative multiple sugar transport system substrate-binding protein|nr:substrate-binding domain-containing protein [Propionibacteriaceae bacterium]